MLVFGIWLLYPIESALLFTMCQSNEYRATLQLLIIMRVGLGKHPIPVCKIFLSNKLEQMRALYCQSLKILRFRFRQYMAFKFIHFTLKYKCKNLPPPFILH